MFFRKRDGAKKPTEAEAREIVLKDLRTRFDTAQDCTDPAERLIRLEEIRTLVDGATSALKGKITKRASENGEFAFLGTMSAGTASAWIIAGLHFPPIFGIAGIVLGSLAGVRAGRRVLLRSHEKQMEKNKPFIDALEVEKQRATDTADALLGSRLRDIASSPKFDELIDRVPRVREQFTRAYGRKIAEENAFDTPQKKKPSDDPHFKL